MTDVIRKLTREQFQQFVEQYYDGFYGRRNQNMIQAFQTFYTQVEDPILSHLTDDERILDHIEKHYVEETESWPVYREAFGG